MTDHSKIRADIDSELVKGLLLVNGGAAVALLAFFPHVLDKACYEPFAEAILSALPAFQFGLLLAVIHNHLRRKCSLAWERSHYAPSPCKVLWFKTSEPCICYWSTASMWCSIAAFLAGGIIVYYGGRETLSQRVVCEAKAQALAPAATLPNSGGQGALGDKAAQRP